MTDQATGHTPPPPEEQRRQLEQVIQGALLGPTPKIYANAFGFAQTAADISMVAIVNGQPISVVIVPYVTAKSLVADLSMVLERFEQATGQKIKTLAEITSDMGKQLEGFTSGGLDKPEA
jgi:citrate lyase beta subunit